MSVKRQPTPVEYAEKLKPGSKMRGNVLKCQNADCGMIFWASRSDRKHCSDACRMREYRDWYREHGIED